MPHGKPRAPIGRYRPVTSGPADRPPATQDRGAHMRKTFRLLAVAVLLCAAAAAVAGCSLTSVKGSEGSQNVDVTMGGHLTKDSTLDFKAVGYSNGQLQIENTATAHALDIGPGTPITMSDGTVVAKVVGTAISIAPGKIGILALDRGLSPSQEYYLGANSSGQPSVRQMFMCPGDASSAAGQSVPTVPDPSESLPSE